MAAGTSTMVLMNAYGPTKKGMAEKRKKYIANLLKSEYPLIAFVQEFKWKNFHTNAWKSFHVPKRYKYIGHSEAGFIVDVREITFLRLDIRSSVRGIYDKMQRKRGLGPDYFDLLRLCVYKMRGKEAPEFELICASWHGPHRIKKKRKKIGLKSMIKFLLKLKVKYSNLPLIVGGDFNLCASDVKALLPSSLELKTFDDRSIDMMIVSSDITKCMKLEPLEKLKKKAAFDHCHLRSDITFLDPIDSSCSSSDESDED